MNQVKKDVIQKIYSWVTASQTNERTAYDEDELAREDIWRALDAAVNRRPSREKWHAICGWLLKASVYHVNETTLKFYKSIVESIDEIYHEEHADQEAK